MSSIKLPISNNDTDTSFPSIKNNPYIIFLDINLTNDDWDGIYLKKELFIKHINSKTIMLTGVYTTKESVLSPVTTTINENISTKIKQLSDVSPNYILADAYRKEKTNSLLHSLTSHQLMHVKLIFDNKCRSQISSELNIELSTVKKNLTRIYKLLNVKSRYQLVETFDKEYVEHLLKMKMKK
ncbi:transcriptional regulator [Ruminiclostridium josui]|uniref:transcriptional regulator n=1 Tax=Ruminiclostridium josui TaxID=1499 RepID=UPI00046489EA|nr:LuxR C-terminal-related transcriptional regulator [Ruminiclostridium josui]